MTPKEAIGHVLRIQAISSFLPIDSTKDFVDILEACARLDQIKIKFNKHGQLVGLIMWANFSDEINHKIIAEGLKGLRSCHINNGAHTWILAFYAAHDDVVNLLYCIGSKWLVNQSEVTYFRMKRNARIVKCVSRNDIEKFLKKILIATNKASTALDVNSTNVQLKKSAEELAEIALALRHLPTFKNLPIISTLNRIGRPTRIEQRRIYHLSDGRFCGYISWAWIDPCSFANMIPEPHEITINHWNEGSVLVILDAIATAAGQNAVLEDLAYNFFVTESIYMRSIFDHGKMKEINRTALIEKEFMSNDCNEIYDVLQKYGEYHEVQ